MYIEVLNTKFLHLQHHQLHNKKETPEEDNSTQSKRVHGSASSQPIEGSFQLLSLWQQLTIFKTLSPYITDSIILIPSSSCAIEANLCNSFGGSTGSLGQVLQRLWVQPQKVLLYYYCDCWLIWDLSMSTKIWLLLRNKSIPCGKGPISVMVSVRSNMRKESKDCELWPLTGRNSKVVCRFWQNLGYFPSIQRSSLAYLTELLFSSTKAFVVSLVLVICFLLKTIVQLQADSSTYSSDQAFWPTPSTALQLASQLFIFLDSK